MKKDNKSLSDMRAAARSGSPEDQYNLSIELIKNSTGSTSSNYIEALSFLDIAANAGYVQAQVAIANELAKNEETYDSAILWLRKAASNKNPYAIRRLGELLYYNSKSDKELIDGIKYLRLSAKMGDSKAAYQLGMIYIKPKNELIMIDEEEAIHYLNMSAKDGNVNAMVSIGFIYANGIDGSVEKDFEISRNSFKSAIDNGSVKSYHDLAVLHFKEAFKLLELGVDEESKNNSNKKNEKIKNSTTLKNNLKNLGVEF